MGSTSENTNSIGWPGLLEIEHGRGRGIERDEVRAGGDRARDAEMALHPVGLVRQVFVDVVGAVFLGEGVKQIERRVVVMRIAGDHLAAEFGLEEIERRLRRCLRLQLLRVVGIGQQADIPDDEGPVGILERLVDGVEALRLEGEHLSLLLPAHEVLRGLEQHHVGFQLAVLELLLDLLIQHIAEAAFDRHRQARKLRSKSRASGS